MDDEPEFRPRRGDEVEAWLLRWQDSALGIYATLLQAMLDEYRDCADRGWFLHEAPGCEED